MTKLCKIGLVALFAIVAGTAQAGMYLDHVDGALAPDTLPTGSTVTFHIGMLVDSDGNITGSTNGFRVYSNTGANWTTSVPTLTGAITTSMLEQFFTNEFSISGTGADTLGFGGFRLFAPGIPVGFDAIVWTIDIGPITPESHCGEICLDSSFYPPASTWKWSTTAGDVFPTWDGPHCYTIYDAAQGPCGGSNTPPELAFIGDQSTDENVLLQFGVSASDSDGDPLAFSHTALPSGASFTDHGDGTGDFSWTPTFNQAGSYPVTFYVSDGTDSDSESIVITVNNVNRPPILASIGNQSTDENVNLSFAISASDPDGGTLSFNISATDLPAGYSFVDNGNNTASFSWTPGFDDAGTYSATFEVSDGNGGTDDETISILVNNVNRAPLWDAEPDYEVIAGDLLDVTITATDPDGDALTLTPLGVIPPGASFVDNLDNSGTLQWTPTLAQLGTWPQAFIADDGTDEDTLFFDIVVKGPNNPPVVDPILDQAITECDTLVVPVSASDSDGDPLALWANGLVANMNFTDNGDGTGEFVFTPSFAQAGAYTVVIVASDGTDSAMTSFDITVENCESGEFAADVAIDPDTIYAAWAYPYEPVSIHIYFGNFSDAHLPGDVDAGSLLINGSIPAISAVVVDSYPGFTGPVLEVEFSMELFVLGYGAFYDFSTMSYNLSGNFNDAQAFSVTGDAVFRGHLSGDVNLDARVDISDLTYLVDYLFAGGPKPRLLETADLNESGMVDISDIILILKKIIYIP